MEKSNNNSNNNSNYWSSPEMMESLKQLPKDTQNVTGNGPMNVYGSIPQTPAQRSRSGSVVNITKGKFSIDPRKASD